MPYGGNDLLYVIENKLLSLERINRLLVDLLKNAIIPMNSLGFYHCDIKSQNILYLENKVRLIDWGISVNIPNNIAKKIPDMLSGHKTQFNAPFSRILFNKYFDSFIFDYLSDNPEITLENKDIKILLRDMLLEYYLNWVKKANGAGHEEFISNYFVPELFKLNKINITDRVNFTPILFAGYCTNILIKYLDFKTKTFDSLKYLNEVYLKNIDIWGFLSTYIDFILSDKYSYQDRIRCSNLIIEFCYSKQYSDKAIDINKVVEKINNFNSLDSNSVNLEKVFEKLSNDN